MDTSDRRFELFSVLFATAMLFQLASVLWIVLRLKEGALIGFVELLQLFACFRVLWRPTPFSLSAAAGCQLLNFAISLPHMPNHRLVTAAINAGVLIVAARRPRSPAEFFQRLAPAVRASVITVYFFAVFHKLNPHFLDPALSCTTPFFMHVKGTIPFLPDTPLVLSLLPPLTIVLESLIPILLCFTRSRHAGIALAFVFHTGLALDVEKHFFDFTSTMFALISVFLPAGFLAAVDAKRDECPVPSLRIVRFVFSAWYGAAMIAAFFEPAPGAVAFYFGGRQFLWWALNALLAWMLYLGLWGTTAERQQFRPRGGLLLVPAFLILNGFCPYLGIKTRSALDMYSNLRVEGSAPNHSIVRTPLDLLGNMRDLVRIISTNDPALMNEYVNPGLLLTYFEFRRYTSRRPDIAVTYERGGKEYVVARVGDDLELSRRWPLVMEKLLWYRPVDPNEGARCQW